MSTLHSIHRPLLVLGRRGNGLVWRWGRPEKRGESGRVRHVSVALLASDCRLDLVCCTWSVHHNFKQFSPGTTIIPSMLVQSRKPMDAGLGEVIA